MTSDSPFIRIYDFFASRRLVGGLLLCIVTCLMFCMVMRISLGEDITDFLPANDRNREALNVYQQISGADRIIAIIQPTDSAQADPDIMVEAANLLTNLIERHDRSKMVAEVQAEVDLEHSINLQEEVYRLIPLLLCEADYHRMDSLLCQPDYVATRLAEDKQALLFPGSSMAVGSMSQDPLGLFTPVMERMQQRLVPGYELYDGHIFTPDMMREIVLIRSRFGGSETQHNAELVGMLSALCDSVHSTYPSLTAHLTGGPAIAVGNATQIKRDSIISVCLAVVLIAALLVYSFRRVKHILLIAVSIAWGWLFALAGLSMVHSDISLIVIGISSIIIGIAVNYPLHLTAHLHHTPYIRSALREIITPLFVGNITTVGAFLALVPLKAMALRDLGVFSALLLVGTMLFVVLCLPHFLHEKVHHHSSHDSAPQSHNDETPQTSFARKHRIPPLYTVLAIVIITIVLGWRGLYTQFDADISHINYMTPQQRADISYFGKLLASVEHDHAALYVVHEGRTLDEALTAAAQDAPVVEDICRAQGGDYTCATQFLVPQSEQKRRLDMWNDFRKKYADRLERELLRCATLEGFAPDAFAPFLSVLRGSNDMLPLSAFESLDVLVHNNMAVSSHDSIVQIVTTMQLPTEHLEAVNKQATERLNSSFIFDVKGMNTALANQLSDNFNYICWACGLIVFIFLWLSFGRLELALLAFLPMALSWMWILGIMDVAGIDFNIVNVILATFIFGQGDDYTIFMTEGCQYEYATRRQMLQSYKRSIIISALIMFIGIGSLIVARHPALHSIASLTIVGMASVVFMAWIIPPLVFRWIVCRRGQIRRRPLKLSAIGRTLLCGVWWLLQLSTAYFYGILLWLLGRRSLKQRESLHRYASWSHRLDIRLLPGVKYTLSNPYEEHFDWPCVVVCNHQSMLDPMCLMAMSHKILIVANERASLNPVVRKMFQWLNFYTIRANSFTEWQDHSLQNDLELFRSYIRAGYSIAIFPEGARNPDSSILRYHKGAFYLANELGVDVLPVYIHGMNMVMPIGEFAAHGSSVSVYIDKRIGLDDPIRQGRDYSCLTKDVHKLFISRYSEICREHETAQYYTPLVMDRYLYKGREIQQTVKKVLSDTDSLTHRIEAMRDQTDVVMHNDRYGALTLLAALIYKEKSFTVHFDDEEEREIARWSAEGLVKNISFI